MITVAVDRAGRCSVWIPGRGVDGIVRAAISPSTHTKAAPPIQERARPSRNPGETNHGRAMHGTHATTGLLRTHDGNVPLGHRRFVKPDRARRRRGMTALNAIPQRTLSGSGRANRSVSSSAPCWVSLALALVAVANPCLASAAVDAGAASGDHREFPGVVGRGVAQLALEDVLDIAAREMHRREDDVVERFLAELNDTFAEIGLDHLEPRLLQRVVQVDHFE